MAWMTPHFSNAIAMPILIAALACLSSVEHPISITEADVYVTQTRVNMQLKMFAEDLYLFQDLEADEFDLLSPPDIKRAIQNHKSFLLERVIIRNVAGEKIPGRLVNLREFEIPEEGIHVGDLMNYSLTYQFEFDLEEPPEFLTFEQNIADANFIYPSEMKLAIKQAGSEAIYAENLKPGKPHTPPRFDWSNPPLSEDASQSEWDAWTARQREESLGITSYSSVYSFIYITDYEVRHEILVPLATLASIFQIDRADESWLEIDEQDAAREGVKKYFGTGNPVTIDGVEVQPVFERIDFHSLDLRDFAMHAPAKRISMASGRVGLIMTYSTKGTPTNVKVKWTKFSPAMLKVRSVVFAFEKVEKTRFSRFANKNVYEWNNPGREPRPEISTIAASLPPKPELTIRPVAYSGLGVGLLLFLAGLRKFGWKAGAVLLVGVGTAVATWSQTSTVDQPFSEPTPVADADARRVFETLHRNVYRAFDYGTEDEVYDALAASVSGELLKEVYLNIRKSLEVREQGGAIARISEVSYMPGERVHDEHLTWPSFRFRSNWTVAGTIEHWGHIHERANQFDGIFTIELKEDAWKITGFEVVDEKRVRAKTRLRKF